MISVEDFGKIGLTGTPYRVPFVLTLIVVLSFVVFPKYSSFSLSSFKDDIGGAQASEQPSGTQGTDGSTSMTSSVQSTVTYKYDALGRLTEVVYPGTSFPGDIIAYQYDSIGNREYHAVLPEYFIDIDNSGAVDLQDVSMILQILSASPVSGINAAADVDGNGKLSFEEILTNLQKLSGYR